MDAKILDEMKGSWNHTVQFLLFGLIRGLRH